MKTSAKVALLTLAIAVPAFALGNQAPAGGWWAEAWPWVDDTEHGEPTSAQLPFFMVLGVLEAVSLGLAVSFLAWGRPAMQRLSGGRQGLATAMMLSAAWVLGNWWVHDNLHQVNGFELGGLLVIEYAFHVTLIAAGATLCYGLATNALAAPAARAAKA